MFYEQFESIEDGVNQSIGSDSCPMLLDRDMASIPGRGKIKAFRTQAAFESWMRKNHADASEVWLRIYKKNSGVPSITIAEALDVVLCWGWIDGLRKGPLTETSSAPADCARWPLANQPGIPRPMRRALARRPPPNGHRPSPCRPAAAGRARKIAALVEMLARGETPHPERR